MMDQVEEAAAREQKESLNIKFPLAGLTLGVVGLALTMVTTDPGEKGPVVILSFLGLLYVALLSCCALLLEFIRYVRNWTDLSRQKKLYLSVIVATGCIFLFGLQTLGQLQLTDVVLVFIFEILLNFYFLRRF